MRIGSELSPAQLAILRTHWEWAGRYAMVSSVLCVVIMGGAFAIFEMLGVEERARTPSLVLLATLILINVVWRAVGALAGRIALIVAEGASDRAPLG
jgi:hypothetical protein